MTQGPRRDCGLAGVEPSPPEKPKCIPFLSPLILGSAASCFISNESPCESGVEEPHSLPNAMVEVPYYLVISSYIAASNLFFPSSE